MIPPIISRRLRQLRMGERMLQLFWGLVRWLCLVVVALGLGCLVDWVWDRYQDVPQEVHYVSWAPPASRPSAGSSASSCALASHRHPRRHACPVDRGESARVSRSAHLRGAAQPQGGEDAGHARCILIEVVTQEAKTRAEAQSFTHVANHDRLGSGLKLLVPVLFVAMLPVLAAPVTTQVLLARHFLGDVEIPRKRADRTGGPDDGAPRPARR